MLLTSTELAEFTAEIERANPLEIEKGDVETALSIYLMLWNQLPESKHQQLEQIANSLINCIFDNYFDMGDYIEAKKWALEGLKNNTAQEGAYQRGKRDFREYDKNSEAFFYFTDFLYFSCYPLRI